MFNFMLPRKLKYVFIHTNTHGSERMKVRTNILIDKEILQTAQALGLNISKTCENSLKQYIAAIQNIKPETNLQNSSGAEGIRTPVRRAQVSKPDVSAGSVLGSLSVAKDVNWTSFETWLQTDHVAAYAKKMVNYAKEYQALLLDGNLGILGGFSKGKRRNVMAALANLAKYSGLYIHWKDLVKQAGLKWEKRSSIETFLSIMNAELSQTKDWLVDAISKVPKQYSTLLVFDLATGLRESESCHSAQLLCELEEEGKIQDYFNADLQMLEHWKYPKLFLRGSKNAYISFVPKNCLSSLLELKPRLTVNALKKALSRYGLVNKWMELRKLHGTTLRNSGIPSEIVDLLHGRIQQNIFLQHYYRPDVLNAIRNKTLQAIEPIVNELIA